MHSSNIDNFWINDFKVASFGKEELSEEEKEGIREGKEDIVEGRNIPFEKANW